MQTPDTAAPAPQPAPAAGPRRPASRSRLSFGHVVTLLATRAPLPDLRPGLPLLSKERKVLADLRRHRQKFQDKGVKVISAKLLGRGTGRPASVALDVVERVFPQILVDQSGRTLQRKPGSASRTTTYELVQGDDRKWRVSFVIPR
jgi:hypothetical protein